MAAVCMAYVMQQPFKTETLHWGPAGGKARDPHRFEKISNIIKQFKLSCSKTQAQFQAMEVRNSNFTAFIDYFTTNTYIMVIMSDPSVQTATTQLNIGAARQHFEEFITPVTGS